MDRSRRNPRFELQEASDTEMTPPCPTYERGNPFDDLDHPAALVKVTVDAMAVDSEQHDPISPAMRRRDAQGGLGVGREALEMGRESITPTNTGHNLSDRQSLLESFKAFSFGMSSKISTPVTASSQPDENAGFKRALQESRQAAQQPRRPPDIFTPAEYLEGNDPIFRGPFQSSTPKSVTQVQRKSEKPRYKIPPPLPLRFNRKDASMLDKRFKSGHGVQALPSPVVKTLRGEASNYPMPKPSPAFQSLPDSPDRKPHDLQQSIHETVVRHEVEDAKKFNKIKHLPTPPHTPGSNTKLFISSPGLLSPPPHTLFSPQTPDRPASSTKKLNSKPDQHAAPEKSVAQTMLETHALDPKFLEMYEIRDELGSGGFGFVCSAWSKIENVEVAVKFIFRARLHSQAVVQDWRPRESTHGILSGTSEKFSRDGLEHRYVPMEAAILEYVDHPGIVGFRGLYEDSTFFYLIQELHGSPWMKHKNTPEQPQYAGFQMGPHSAGPHFESFAESSGDISSSSSASSFYSAASGLAPSPSSQSTFSEYSGPLTPENQMRRGSAPDTTSSLSPLRPGLMQRRSSHDLFECIEANDRFDEKKAKFIFKQVAETVAYLHRNGICHRDIKDENIVIDDKLQVKLIDFGSAVWYDARHEPPYYNQFFGTLNYASIEILRGFSYQAAPAEVYSLGILLSILLTGVPPFDNPRDAAHLRFNLKYDITRDAQSLLSKCLHPNPKTRWTIDEILRHRWLAPEGPSRLPSSSWTFNGSKRGDTQRGGRAT